MLWSNQEALRQTKQTEAENDNWISLTFNSIVYFLSVEWSWLRLFEYWYNTFKYLEPIYISTATL